MIPTRYSISQVIFIVVPASAVVGALFAGLFVYSEEEWPTVAGAVIQAAVTAAAVIFTSWQTRTLFEAQRKEEKARDERLRSEEIHRCLSIAYIALQSDLDELCRVEFVVRDALESRTSEEERYRLSRNAYERWNHPNRRRFDQLLDAIGDVEMQISRLLLTLNETAQRFMVTVEAAQLEVQRSGLRAGFTKQSAEFDLQMIRQIRYLARVLMFLIEEYLERHKIGKLPNWHNVSLSHEQMSECRKLREPIDMTEMKARLESASQAI